MWLPQLHAMTTETLTAWVVEQVTQEHLGYPAVMVTTGDHDDRVVPAHSFKYTATLQAADTGAAPKLIRIEMQAGHGAGTPTSKVIGERVDLLAFLAHTFGMDLR